MFFCLWSLFVLVVLAAASGECEEECRRSEICESAQCQPLTCFDLKWTEGESDVDCGGTRCLKRCTAGLFCNEDDDCASRACGANHRCLPKECMDAVLNGNETSVDCGGPQCEPCGDGKDCDVNADCESNQCETNDRFICLSSTCKTTAAAEQCGQSPSCPRCKVGDACEHDAQCESEYCENGKCRSNNCETCGASDNCPLCSAGEQCDRNEQCASNMCSELTNKCLAETCELEARCGGGICDACTLGGKCNADEDCIAGLKCDEEDSQCVPTHCFNGKLDVTGEESDVDCGGSLCTARCPNLSKCEVDADCVSKMCDIDAKRCVPQTCTNQKQDNGESGVDCGGSGGCLPCQKPGSGCITDQDVDATLGLVCHDGLTVPAHCADNVVSGDETGVDCGGPTCFAKCKQGDDCTVNSDCESNDCIEGVCASATCHNNRTDFGETDLDCGGLSCRACSVGMRCTSDQDCDSGMCSEFHFKCQPPECSTRCGGLCDPCPDATLCSSDSDCASGFCFGDGLPTIPRDTMFVFPEAARGLCIAESCRVGCGKGDCPGCPAGAYCQHNSECASGSCDKDNARCFASTCFDSRLGEEETDVDCGGAMCPKCLNQFATCREDSDCISGHCGKHNGKCLPTTCRNQRRDGQETGLDCGGEECEPCAYQGDACELSQRDCAEGMLCSPTSRVCVRNSCLNGIREANETDIDCGPNCFKLCSDFSQCELDKECASGYCFQGSCAPEHCRQECGLPGNCPNKCVNGEPCQQDDQCLADSHCLDGEKCVDEKQCAVDWKLSLATDPSGCGGALCPRCRPHRICRSNRDCDDDLVCNANKCEFETCFDGQLSFGEICVDGGGVCKRRCSLGEQCKSDFDCQHPLSCSATGVCTTDKPRRERKSAAAAEIEIPPPTPVAIQFSPNVYAVLAAPLVQFEREVAEFESSRKSQVELDSLQWSTRALPQRSLDSLCNVELGCVLEEIDSSSNAVLRAHSFYSFTESASITVWSHFQGFFLQPGVLVSFTNGLQVVSTSVVGSRAFLELQGACDFQQGGLVVEYGSKLTVLGNTTMRGAKLVVFGEVVIHDDVQVDFDSMSVFGKLTVLGQRVVFAKQVDVFGTLLVSATNSATFASVNVKGMFAVEHNGHADLQSDLNVDGGLVYIAADSAITLSNAASNFYVATQHSLVYLQGKLTCFASLRLFAGKFVSTATSTCKLISNAMEVSNAAELTVLSAFAFENAKVAFHAAAVYALQLPMFTPSCKLAIHGNLTVLDNVQQQKELTWSASLDLFGRLAVPNQVNKIRFASTVTLACGNACLVEANQRTTLVFDSPVVITEAWRIPALLTVDFHSAVWFANAVDNLGTLYFHSTAFALFTYTYAGKGHIINKGKIHVLGDAELETSVGGNGQISVGYVPLRDFSRHLFASAAFTCTQPAHKQTVVLILTNAVYLHVEFCFADGTAQSMLNYLQVPQDLTSIVFSKTRFGNRLALDEHVPNTVYCTPTTGQLEFFLTHPTTASKRYLESSHSNSHRSLIELVGSHLLFSHQSVSVLARGKLVAVKGSRSTFQHQGRLESATGGRITLESKSQMTFQSRSTFHTTGSNITVGENANLTLTHASLQVSHGTWENFGLMHFGSASNVSLSPRFFHNSGDLHSQSDSTISLTSPSSTAPRSDFYFFEDSIFDALGYVYIGENTVTRFFNNSLFQASGDLVVEGDLDVDTRFAYLDGLVDVSGHLVVRGSGSLLKASTAAMFTMRGQLAVEAGAQFDFQGKDFKLVSGGIVSVVDTSKCRFGGERFESSGRARMTGAFVFSAQRVRVYATSRIEVLRRSQITSTSFMLGESAELVVSSKLELSGARFATEVNSLMQITETGTVQVVSGEFDIRGQFINLGVLVLDNPSLVHLPQTSPGSLMLRARELHSAECSAAVVQVYAGATLQLVRHGNDDDPIVCAYSLDPIEIKTGGTLHISGGAHVRLFRPVKLGKGARIIVDEASTLQLANHTKIFGPGSIEVRDRSKLVANGAVDDGAVLEVSNKSRLILDGRFLVGSDSRVLLDTESLLELASKRHYIEISPTAELCLRANSRVESFGHVINMGNVLLESGSRAFLYGGDASLSGLAGNLKLQNQAKLQLQGSHVTVEQNRIDVVDNSAITFKSCESCGFTAAMRVALVSSRLLVEGPRTVVKLAGLELQINPRSKLLVNAQGNVSLSFAQVVDCYGVISIVNHESSLVIERPTQDFQLKRHGRLLVEAGSVSLHSAMAQFSMQSTLRVSALAGFTCTSKDMVFDQDSHFACAGDCLFSGGKVKASNDVVVEGKLRFHGTVDSLVSLRQVTVQPSGTLELKSLEDDAVFTIAKLTTLGYLIVGEYCLLAIGEQFRSSGDLLVGKFAKLTLLKQASFEKSYSTVRLDGELIVERGALLQLFSTVVKSNAGGMLTVHGVAEAHNAVEMDFGGIVNVTSVGTWSGSATFRNCDVQVYGRVDFAHGTTGSVLAIVGGNFDLLPNAMLEANVYYDDDDGGNVVCDVIDVKQGSVRLSPKSIISLAISAESHGKSADVAPIVTDAGRLTWQRGSIRVAAFSTSKQPKAYTTHAFEVEQAKSSSLHIRIELQRAAATAADEEGSAIARQTLGSIKIHTVQFTTTKDGALPQGWELTVSKYLGGPPVLKGSNNVISIPCFEPVECHAFCTLFKYTKSILQTELKLTALASADCSTSEEEPAWSRILVPCVTDGKRGTASIGELCDFPFDHLGVTYSTCAKDLVHGEWCLTELGHWGGCICSNGNLVRELVKSSKKQSNECWTNGLGNAPADVQCAFPFFESSDSYQAHFACVGSGLGGEGFCRTVHGELGGCTCRKPAAALPAGGVKCITNGRGNAPAGKQCVFPFTWRNRMYSHCVGASWGSGEGFCVTKQGERGGCVCDDANNAVQPLVQDDQQEDDDFVYFLHGPSVHVRSHQVIEVLATPSRLQAKWYVFALPRSTDSILAPPPHPLRDNLKDATAYSFTTNVVLRNLHWDLVYDLYFYLPGFEREDVMANALYEIKLKPPPPPVEHKVRFDLVDMPASLTEGETVTVELESIDDDEVVDLRIELSQETNQVIVSPRKLELRGRKRGKLEITALEDGVVEGPHSVMLHMIDLQRAETVSIELVLVDSKKQQQAALRREEGIVFAFSQRAVVASSTGEHVLDAHERTYSLRLSTAPNSPVLIELEDVDNAVQVISPLVFGRMDWDQYKQVEVHSSSRSGRIRHRVQSTDLRFIDLDQFVHVPADLLVPQSKEETTAAAPLAFPNEVYLFPRSSAEIVLSSPQAKLEFTDPRIRFRKQDDAVTIIVWVEEDPGYSFSADLILGFASNTACKVHYVSRIPAIVLSQQRLAGGSGDYLISLSLPANRAVTVHLSTDTDSVCMDLHAEFKRPCTVKNCLWCLQNQPELVLEPNVVRFPPSSTQPIRIRVLGWNNQSKIYDSRRSPTLYISHCVQEQDEQYNKDTITVFGPFDTAVRGLQVDLLEHRQPVPASMQIKATTRKRLEFAVELNYLPRAAVEITEPACNTLVLPAGTVAGKLRCNDDDRDTFTFVSHSEDALFDDMRVEMTVPPSLGTRMSRMLRMGLNLVALLVTVVAVLFVWIQVGPHTYSAKRNRRSKQASIRLQDNHEDLAERWNSAAPAMGDLHEYDIVIVEYYGSQRDEQEPYYRSGRVFGEEDVFMRSWAVGFFSDDGDVDFEVETQSIRKLAIDDVDDCVIDVVLHRRASDEDFGLKIGWTNLNRALIIGFIPLSPAFMHTQLRVGDKIIQVNGVDNFDSLDQVLRCIQSETGGKLKLRLQRPTTKRE